MIFVINTSDDKITIGRHLFKVSIKLNFLFLKIYHFFLTVKTTSEQIKTTASLIKYFVYFP